MHMIVWLYFAWWAAAFVGLTVIAMTSIHGWMRKPQPPWHQRLWWCRLLIITAFMLFVIAVFNGQFMFVLFDVLVMAGGSWQLTQLNRRRVRGLDRRQT